MTGRTNVVPVAPAQVAPTQVAPARAPLAEPESRASRVRATLRRLRTHLDGRRAKYRLRIENRSRETVETRTYAYSLGRPTLLGAAVPFSVPPGAVLSVSLSIDLPRASSARVVTEALTPGGTLVFEEGARPRESARLLAVFAVLALGVVALFGSGLFAPSIVALAAPHDVRASRPFAVAYAFARTTVADYTVVSVEGVEAGRGTLAVPDGSFDLALPHELEPHAYDIRVSARSPFGDAVRTFRVFAEPDLQPILAKRVVKPRSQPALAPTIDRLALERDTVVGGRPIVVSYRASSLDGMVRLIDQAGTVRAEALLSRRGNSILLAPFVDADQDFRVVVHATKGTQQVEQSIAVRIKKAHSLDDTLATARRKNDGPIALVEENVAPGDPIEVGIVRYEPGLRIALVDPQGQEVAASAVASDQNEVTLTAPALAGRARYTVTATFKNGVSEETVIRNVTIGAGTQAP